MIITLLMKLMKSPSIKILLSLNSSVTVTSPSWEPSKPLLKLWFTHSRRLTSPSISCPYKSRMLPLSVTEVLWLILQDTSLLWNKLKRLSVVFLSLSSMFFTCTWLILKVSLWNWRRTLKSLLMVPTVLMKFIPKSNWRNSMPLLKSTVSFSFLKLTHPLTLVLGLMLLVSMILTLAETILRNNGDLIVMNLPAVNWTLPYKGSWCYRRYHDWNSWSLL